VKVWQTEPALLSGAIIAVVNFANLMGWVSLTPDQMNGLNIALAAVLAVFTRQSVTSSVNIKK
jgi:hypothetical protein